MENNKTLCKTSSRWYYTIRQTKGGYVTYSIPYDKNNGTATVFGSLRHFLSKKLNDNFNKGDYQINKDYKEDIQEIVNRYGSKEEKEKYNKLVWF